MLLLFLITLHSLSITLSRLLRAALCYVPYLQLPTQDDKEPYFFKYSDKVEATLLFWFDDDLIRPGERDAQALPDVLAL